MNRVLTTLDAAAEAYRVHRHPPIRAETDLALTGLDWTCSVKTLAFELPDARVALVGVPGPARIRYAAVAAALGVPRSRLRPASVESLAALGLQPGGVSPVATDPGVVLVLDAAVPGMGTVYCGGGDPETTIELEASALVRLAGQVRLADLTSGVADPDPGRRATEPEQGGHHQHGAVQPGHVQ